MKFIRSQETKKLRNYLFLRQQSRHSHGPVELILDDPEVSSVLDLRLDDLRDDLLPLAPTFGAPETDGAVRVENALT